MGTLLPEYIQPLVVQNARNVTLPTHDVVEKSTERLHEQFERFSVTDDIFPVFPKSIIQDTILQDNARYISKYPWVNPNVVKECQEILQRLRLSASVGDKHATDLFALCSGTHAEHIICATVLSPSFSLVGVQASNGGANTFIQAELHRSALEHGILDLARDYKCVGKHFLSTGKWHQHLLTCPDVKCFQTKAPSAFQLLKWKSQEKNNQLLFRLVISNSKHFLKKFSRLICRSLSLLFGELHMAYPAWGTPSLPGVRYFVGLEGKWFQGKRVLAERDIDNAYWELPKEGVYDSLKQAAQLVCTQRGMRGQFLFSIAREYLSPWAALGSCRQGLQGCAPRGCLEVCQVGPGPQNVVRDGWLGIDTEYQRSADWRLLECTSDVYLGPCAGNQFHGESGTDFQRSPKKMGRQGMV